MRRKQNIDVSYIFYDVEKKSRIKADMIGCHTTEQ